MKHKFGIVAMALAIALVGCGNAAQESTEETTEPAAEEQTATLDPATANDIVTGKVWQCTYAGTDDPMMAAIVDETCLISNELFEMQDGMFPGIEVVKSSKNGDTTTYYTVTEIDNYTLEGSVLRLASCAITPTRYDLKANDDGTYTVTNRMMAEDGSNYDSSILAMCDNDKDLAEQMKTRRVHLQTRLDFIRDYIAKYNMGITGLVDTGDVYYNINTTEEPVDENAEAAAKAEAEREEAEKKAAEAKAAAEKAEADAKAAEEQAAKEKAAAEKAEADRKAAEEAAKKKQEEEQKPVEPHTEGEAVTIELPTATSDVYATWHKDSNGYWWAQFWTYNGTEVWATPASDGGWIFYAVTDHGLVQIIRCNESTDEGAVGPDGVSSHWSDAATNTIYY